MQVHEKRSITILNGYPRTSREFDRSNVGHALSFLALTGLGTVFALSVDRAHLIGRMARDAESDNRCRRL